MTRSVFLKTTFFFFFKERVNRKPRGKNIADWFSIHAKMKITCVIQPKMYLDLEGNWQELIPRALQGLLGIAIPGLTSSLLSEEKEKGDRLH